MCSALAGDLEIETLPDSDATRMFRIIKSFLYLTPLSTSYILHIFLSSIANSNQYGSTFSIKKHKELAAQI